MTLHRVMLLVRCATASLRFYREVCGMVLLEQEETEGCTTYYLSGTRANSVVVPGSDQTRTRLWNEGPVLALKHIHGTENSKVQVYSAPQLSIHSRGYGHVALLVDDVLKSCNQMSSSGVRVHKEVGQGLPAASAYVIDPDGYWVELMPKYKAPVYRSPGKFVFDGEWSEYPPQKIRGLQSGLNALYRTMH